MPETDAKARKLFSIVTVVYNDVDEIQRTIASALGQEFDSYEYIIIDGASKDGTLELIQQYKSRICVLSERDSGLYDAMNKGLDLANSEYVLFLNAGDYFVNSSVLSNVAASIGTDRPDCIYGNNYVMLLDGTLTFRKAASDLSNIWKRSQFSHQALFTKTALARQYKFDLSYSIAADYCMILRLYLDSFSFLYCDLPISIYKTGGVSDDRRVRMVRERFSINRKYNNNPKVYLTFPVLLISAFVKQILKRVISRRHYESIRRKVMRQPYETLE